MDSNHSLLTPNNRNQYIQGVLKVPSYFLEAPERKRCICMEKICVNCRKTTMLKNFQSIKACITYYSWGLCMQNDRIRGRKVHLCVGTHKNQQCICFRNHLLDPWYNGIGALKIQAAYVPQNTAGVHLCHVRRWRTFTRCINAAHYNHFSKAVIKCRYWRHHCAMKVPMHAPVLTNNDKIRHQLSVHFQSKIEEDGSFNQ